MSGDGLIPALQSDALAREIEHQLKQETAAVIAAAEKEATAALAQARATARARLCEAIAGLRREGALRLARARAQHDAELRSEAQLQSARAVADAMPLLRDALNARWQMPEARQQWIAAVAALAGKRLRRGAWLVGHAADWRREEQMAFVEAVGGADDITFQADTGVSAGLRITADHATLDATADGLIADSRTIAALLLDELTKGAPA